MSSTTVSSHVTHDRDCAVVPARRRRRAALLGLAVGGTALIGTGAFSSWQATSNASSGALSAASIAVQMLDANGGAFTSSVTNLLPGDYFYRYVDLANTGTAASTFAGQVTGTGDLGSALLAQVETCSLSWVTVGSTSTCPGSRSTLAAEQALTSPLTVDHGRIDTGSLNAQHVRYRFKLSDGADAALQGKGGGVSVSVSGSVVGGRDRTTG